MAKRPKNRRVDIPATDLAPSPIMMTAKAIENRRGRKQDEKYQDALREMGMFDNAGGRGGGVRGGMAKDDFRGRAQRMKKGGKVKKYMSGGRAEATKKRDEEMMRKGPSRRPRLGPNREMERLEGEAGMARQQDNMRNKRMEREAAGTAYKKGGKVRGCGMARGGAVRPCKMVKMKGS